MTYCDKIITIFFFFYKNMGKFMKRSIWFTVTLSSLKKKTSKEVIEKKNKDEKLKSHDYFMPNAEV